MQASPRFTHDSPISQFCAAIRAAGLEPPVVIEDDGKIHRFASNGKPGDDAGWYVYHGDGIPAGRFGCWREHIDQPWKADIGRSWTPAEQTAHKAKVHALQAARDAEQVKMRSEAATRARTRFEAAPLATDAHAYLIRKSIKPHGVKLDGERLMIPMRADGVLHSLQFIEPHGEKRFLPGGRVKGCYFSIGTVKDAAAMYITEGFATGATVHEITGQPVAVAFNAGNLELVAVAMREKYPDLPLILCADDDINTTGNPGITKATVAALAVNGLLAVPDFGPDRREDMTDFNDVAAHCGSDAVRAALQSAQQPVRAEYEENESPPEPLPTLPDVLPFDYAYLPDALRGYVQDISERMQCPPDFAAVGVFVMLAAIIGRKLGIRPKRRDNWTVIPNLWGGLVGTSGIMKSPTLGAALAPLKKLQGAAFDEHNNAVAEYGAKAELAKLQKAVNKTEARKVLKADTGADVASLLKANEADDAPILKRYITNNASYQALGELLMENPHGLLVEADELIGLLKSLDSDGQQEARAFYLTAADGDKPYTFDRILRGKGLHIEALCVSIIGGIQPGVLAEYVRQATAGGAGADGLLQRFGLMVYPDISPDWKDIDRYPDATAREGMRLLVNRLDSLDPADRGAETDLYGGVPFLHFDTLAQVLFSEWRAQLEQRLRSGEEHPAIVSHLSKYRKLIPSLALINHLCDADTGAVSEKSLLRAIAFSEYLESHARRIYSYATRPDIDAAKTLLKRLASGKLSNPFKVRDIYRAGWTGLETPTKAQAAINLLLEYQHVQEEVPQTGGRPTTLYHWREGVSP